MTLSERIESLKSKSNVISKSQSEFVENRKAKILRDEYEKQIDSLKKQHELSIKRLNNEIEKLYGEKTALMTELDQFKHSNSNLYQPDKLNKNRSAVSSMNAGDSLSVGILSQISNSNNEDVKKSRNELSNQYKFEEPHFIKNVTQQETNFKNLTRLNSDLEMSSSMKQPSRMSIANQLRYDEQRRKRELENMLDNHIEDLRRSSVNDHANNFNLVK